MMIENAAAFQFFLSEDIYLLKSDLDKLYVDVPDTTDDLAINDHDSTSVLAADKSPELTFVYAGKNKKQFLVICHYPGAELMDDKHFEALTNTLKRKDFMLDDVAVLNLANYTSAIAEQLQQYFKPKTLLVLGDTARVKGWDNFVLNQLEDNDGMKTLYTHSFTEMMADRDKAKAFWEQMKLL